MTWTPIPLIELACKCCGKKLELTERFTVCRFKEIRWIRCEKCQQRADTITQGSVLVRFDAKTKVMQRFSEIDITKTARQAKS